VQQEEKKNEQHLTKQRLPSLSLKQLERFMLYPLLLTQENVPDGTAALPY
jgi:hypothetical protein